MKGLTIVIIYVPSSSSSSFCGAGGTPPNVLQPTQVDFTNPALVYPFHLQRRSTSYA
jgi:hypothetical protein